MQIDNNKNNNKNKKKGLTQALTAGPAGSNESRKTVRQRRIGQEWLKSMISSLEGGHHVPCIGRQGWCRGAV
ncbi:hypothetical protein E4U09_003102 [Claviceps aff. purpurea]|uniref:Uncharacterized protein n=1 Tax=Claviceps aff. purpurea TaxID=1967640 RepID=A0A9P7TY62_9HYPO|nr:hypothetical protein E4U09_003102 [Claviceps aff. purpurea]